MLPSTGTLTNRCIFVAKISEKYSSLRACSLHLEARRCACASLLTKCYRDLHLSILAQRAEQQPC